ncbi:MAG: hypothetical protein FWG82_01420 [Oscillospiraceae bacterium]|nr:hypothetical protein [Oscillospiraceae bacterium]
MKKAKGTAKRILALLVIFGLLFGVGSAALADDSAGGSEPTTTLSEPNDETMDNDGEYEFTDFFTDLLYWVSEHFGDDIANVVTKILLKAGTVLAKIGLKLIVKPVVKQVIKNSIF